VSGQDDDRYFRLQFFYRLREFEPVHKRHFDIGDEDVRFYILYHRKRDFSVARFAGKRKARLFPIDFCTETFADDHFIIDDKNAVHIILRSRTFRRAP